jgi:hypothetical protein
MSAACTRQRYTSSVTGVVFAFFEAGAVAQKTHSHLGRPIRRASGPAHWISNPSAARRLAPAVWRLLAALGLAAEPPPGRPLPAA